MSDRIPVVVLTAGARVEPVPGDATIVLSRPPHAHPAGAECPSCAAIGDVRVPLFELLQSPHGGQRERPARVLVDASGIADIGPTIDRLTGKAPATAMRDHTVARAYVLSEVL